MQPDDLRLADTISWLSKVRNDLRAAQVDLDAQPPLIQDTLFHAQQAVEKSLKAFLVWHDRPFRKTHDINELSGPCVDIDPTLSAILAEAVILTRYAWQSRYPGEATEPTRRPRSSSDWPGRSLPPW